jgi:hypothetical protein
MTSPGCPQESETRKNCPCPITGCDNHSRCCLCVTNHRQSGKPTYCMAALVRKHGRGE